MSIKLLKFNGLVLFLLCCNSLFAQKTAVFTDPDAEFKNGMELFNKQKYVAAQECFRDVIMNSGETFSDIRSDAEYFSAICGIELFNKDAEYQITGFITRYPESNRIKSAWFQLGKYLYREKKYKNAISWLEKVDVYDLNKAELAEYRFKLGYSYFVTKDYDKSAKLLYDLKDDSTSYSVPASYFYSHIEYIRKNYEMALQGFLKLTMNPQFGPIVPYYITQIYYYQEKYDMVISYAPALLDSATTKRQPEIARIIGEAYYRTLKFKEAVPYLLKYKEKSQSYTREDNYQLGYAYFRSFDYTNASKIFEIVSAGNDSLGQNAYYNLADCYLKLNNKPAARLAFSAASKMEFDEKIREDATYNYAKLTYEISYSPFNEAIKAFQDYISKYPGSPRLDEAYNYLTKVFMSTKNYSEALKALENIQGVTSENEEAYQRAAFFRALELYNDLDYPQAIIHFDKSLNNAKYNENFRALATYWKGEAYYRLNRFDDAITFYNKFLLTQGAFGIPEYKIAHYNLGYCFFKKKDYEKSMTWFRKYTDKPEEADPLLLGDSYIRTGDCFFISRKYDNAGEFYQKAIDIKANNCDYAVFQKGFTLGLLKDQKQKIAFMDMLIKDFPNSSYLDDAYYELGNAYVMLEDKDNALKNYTTVLNNYNSSNWVKKAYLKMAMVYYNNDLNQDAIRVYKEMISKYPESPEVKEALQGLKVVFVDIGDVDAYFTYVKDIGQTTDVSMAEQDSLFYTAAEKIYMSGNCEKSRDEFKKYLDKFPAGSFVLNAWFYKAECDYTAKIWGEALQGYGYVLGQPKNLFTEKSLARASSVNFNLQKYAEALPQFRELQKIAEYKTNMDAALIGEMRCCYALNEYKDAISAGDKVLLIDKLPEELARESRFLIAKSYYSLGEPILAEKEFRMVALNTKSKEGAESKFMVIDIAFSLKKYDVVTKEVFDFVKKSTPHQYWLAKSFLVLSDMYLAKDSTFQAKQTLKSVIDNYEIRTDGIIETALAKMNAIVKKEELMQQQLDSLKTIDTTKIEVQFDDVKSERDAKLFNEEADPDNIPVNMNEDGLKPEDAGIEIN